jgi:hypothetical protein
MTDFLDEKRKEIETRLRELKPLVDEYHRLEAAVSALAEAVGSAASAVVPVRRGHGRPRRSVSKTASTTTLAAPVKKRGRPPGRKKVGRPKTKTVGRPPSSATASTAAAATTSAPATKRRRAGRRKGSGARSTQALSLVKKQPGITIPELAEEMGIKQNYLYRVLPALEQEGKISKQGRGWHPQSS